MSRPKRTTNRESWRYVDQRVAFQGSSLRGETYAPGGAPSAHGSWLSEYEHEQYRKHQPYITYVVWSFYTPIAYYIERPSGVDGLTGWYKVGQTFSSRTSAHQSGALRNVPGHAVVRHGTRGNWTVYCADCGTTRYFSRKPNAESVIWSH